MIQQRLKLEMAPAFMRGDRMILAGDKATQMASANALSQFNTNGDWSDGYQFMHRLPPAPDIGQIDQMENQSTRLLVEMAIQQPGSFDGKWNLVLCRPAHKIGQQISMIGQVVAGKSTVQVGW